MWKGCLSILKMNVERERKKNAFEDDISEFFVVLGYNRECYDKKIGFCGYGLRNWGNEVWGESGG